jgi:hypothetical protein
MNDPCCAQCNLSSCSENEVKMKQKRVLLTLIALVLTSLTCTLPFSTPSEPSQVEIDELNAMITADIELGGMSEQDINADGVTDNIYYTFPTYELQEGVFLTKTYVMENPDGDDFYPGIIVAFNNKSEIDQAFKFILEVPKEFASDAAELSFSLEPAEILEPDPILSFNVSINPEQQVDQLLTVYSVSGLDEKDLPRAKQVLMETAFAEATENCNNTYFPMAFQKEQCYLNLAVDFKNFINLGALEPYCDLTGENGKTSCLAIVNKDITKCMTVTDSSKQENCKGFFINDLCKAEKTEEDRIICLGREAVQNKSPNACKLLPDLDLQNYCLAKVHNKTHYCDRIQDEDLKNECVAALGDITRSQSGSSGKTVQWFYDMNAERDCLRFTAVNSTFPLTKAIGTKETLTCEFGNQKDEFTFQIWIKLFDTPEIAAAEWKQYHKMGKYELGINPLMLVLESQTETSYFYVQKFDYSDVTSSYQLDAGELIGRGYIYFQQKDMQSGDSAYWVATRAQAKQLIGE